MLLLSRLFLLGGTITTALSTPSIPPEIPKRIVVKSNQMGLKKQLKLLKRFEAIQTVSASSYKPKEKTRFKKKTNPNGLDDEALRLLRRKKATLVEAATGPSVTPLYIIDGYNVINQWPKLKKLFRKGDLEESRRKLIDELCELSAMKGARYLIIFDGACNLNTFNEPGFTTSNPRVSVMFSSNGKTADDLIEAKAFEMREAKLTGKIVVVTNDVEVKRQAEGERVNRRLHQELN